MKKQKGMTLVEIVISMAIYGILALLLTEIMTCVNASMRATRQLNNRLSYEAKFADNQLTSGANANFTLNEHGFVINPLRPVFYGLCTDCANKKEAENDVE